MINLMILPSCLEWMKPIDKHSITKLKIQLISKVNDNFGSPKI